MLPTFLAAAGEPEIKEKLLKGYKAGNRTYKVCIDGYNMLPYFEGKEKESPRKFYFYVNDDGELVALRFNDWKAVFMEQRAKTLQCWLEPFVHLIAPKLFHLRRDPFERADENSNVYFDWWLDHCFIMAEAQILVSQMSQSMIDFPPRQRPGSFNLDKIMDQIQATSDGGMH
jgi:arylsulfatase